MFAEQKVGCSLRWRLHEKLLQRYSCLARLLPGELLHQSFLPRIFIILTTNVSADVDRRTFSRNLTSPLLLPSIEGAASSEGSRSDLLYFPALQPQTGAALGDDGAADPRCWRSEQKLLVWWEGLHSVLPDLQIWLRGGATGTA